MSTRARRIILNLWPVERRRKLILRANVKRPDWEIVKDKDVLQIIDICMEMQKIKKLDNHNENNARINMPRWISNTVKNIRSLDNQANKESTPVIETEKSP
ncbi:uncharacterized protein LOC123259807 [Cotesia glomerata]|nr:uncharacterized protein LOC123259807 [Cotesia glomerata]